MKIRFVINKRKGCRLPYSLEIKGFFGWKKFGTYRCGYGGRYFEHYYNSSKKELLKMLKEHYNKNNIDIIQYPSIKIYGI